MADNTRYSGLEPERQKSEYEIHVCVGCKHSKRCSEQQLACQDYRVFLNPKLVSEPITGRIPSKELYQ